MMAPVFMCNAQLLAANNGDGVCTGCGGQGPVGKKHVVAHKHCGYYRLPKGAV